MCSAFVVLVPTINLAWFNSKVGNELRLTLRNGSTLYHDSDALYHHSSNLLASALATLFDPAVQHYIIPCSIFLW